MICPSCRKAAQLIATRDSGKNRNAAGYLHAKCESPTTCSCQHEVRRPGEVLVKRHDG